MHPILTEFEAAVVRHPQRPAASDQSLVLDYQTFRAVAAGLATQIDAATARPHVGVLAPTSSACAAAIFACWYAGRTPVPLNFLLPPADLAKIIHDADIDLLVTIEHFAPVAQQIGVKSIVLDGNTLVPGRRDAPAAAAGDLGAMIYTSGTSGDPKGVRLTFDNIVQNVKSSVAHAQITADEVLVSVLPQFHSFGFTTLTILPLMIGAQAHYLPRFSPAAVLSTIHEKRATVFMAVASMYAALLKLKRAEPQALATLKLAISGGEPLSLSVADEFEQRFGVQINEGYGLTETSPVVSINLPWNRRPGSVGTALPGVRVWATDAEGRELPAGEEGELAIAGHCLMQGYHNKPEQTAATIRGGALFTGDVGRVDEDGFIYITGRVKEMIIVGGENVFPREIENVLLAHPAVAEAAVVGARDDLRGEAPVAFVILQEGAVASEPELRHFCRQRLPGFKAPRDVRIEKDLPRGPTGKILKRSLRP